MLVFSGTYGLIVLDEINVAISLTLLSIKEVLTFLDILPDSCDIVFTGRYADARFLKRADFITECLEVKHPFQNNVAAKKGIEY